MNFWVYLNNYCRPDEVFQQYQKHIPADIFRCSHGPLPPSTTHSLKVQDVCAVPLTSTGGICGLKQTVCAWTPPLHPWHNHHWFTAFGKYFTDFNLSSSAARCRSSSHRKYWSHWINWTKSFISWVAVYKKKLLKPDCLLKIHTQYKTPESTD